MFDIHSHIIHGIDDGAKTLEESLSMISTAQSEGFEYIAATPHYARGYYENSYDNIREKVKELNNILKEKDIKIKVLPGQEVYIDDHTLRDYKSGLLGCIGDSSYMLVEFPMDTLPKNALDILYELRVRGANPIIAHPERYRYFIEKPSLINRFLEEEYLFQINTVSLKGVFGKKVRDTAVTFIKHGIVSFVGSDCHSLNKRCPGIKDGIDLINEISPNIIEDIEKNYGCLLQDKPMEVNYSLIKERKSIFSFLIKNKT
ncbi:protein-tyrosine phosphatase [Clostridium pascui]|uniref:tyrosine-protein phosphatase n=1 Tax=Clostridium pascui TaxID=46609 RepID=UPI00195D4AAC|nr:CpsB/CapC family capsule biosynthesis tyrosine phosphatase [Clostridium pascui]MBM7869831.1 protein-tyrosine phosphatase [Clostridium pascui]